MKKVLDQCTYKCICERGCEGDELKEYKSYK